MGHALFSRSLGSPLLWGWRAATLGQSGEMCIQLPEKTSGSILLATLKWPSGSAHDCMHCTCCVCITLHNTYGLKGSFIYDPADGEIHVIISTLGLLLVMTMLMCVKTRRRWSRSRRQTFSGPTARSIKKSFIVTCQDLLVVEEIHIVTHVSAL